MFKTDPYDHFYRTSIKANTGLDTATVAECLKSEELALYLNKIVDVGYKKSSSNWFARQEIHFLRLVLEINHQVREGLGAILPLFVKIRVFVTTLLPVIDFLSHRTL